MCVCVGGGDGTRLIILLYVTVALNETSEFSSDFPICPVLRAYVPAPLVFPEVSPGTAMFLRSNAPMPFPATV